MLLLRLVRYLVLVQYIPSIIRTTRMFLSCRNDVKAVLVVLPPLSKGKEAKEDGKEKTDQLEFVCHEQHQGDNDNDDGGGVELTFLLGVQVVGSAAAADDQH